LSKSHARANENMRRVFFFQRTGYCHVNSFEGKQLRLELQLQIRTSEKTVPLQGKDSQTWLLMYWHHACLPKAICSIKDIDEVNSWMLWVQEKCWRSRDLFHIWIFVLMFIHECQEMVDRSWQMNARYYSRIGASVFHCVQSCELRDWEMLQ
jgi:hypothetical protein